MEGDQKQQVEAGGSKPTQHFDAKGNEVFPCRCGQTHGGDYAFEDWAHHNCFHEAPLNPLAETGDLLCPECGEVFNVSTQQQVPDQEKEDG